MKQRRRAMQWVKLIAVIIAFVTVATVNMVTSAQSAFLGNEAQSEAVVTEALEPKGDMLSEVALFETEIIGTDPVEIVFCEKESNEPKMVTLSNRTVNVVAAARANVEETEETKKAEESKKVEDAEKWVDMHISVDVTTIYDAPNGEYLETGYFTTKVQMSSEKCEKGWAKIKLSDGRVGYIKTENLMSANQMLENFRYLFAQILYAEAGGVSKGEMRLVGEVVLNRLTTDYWEFEPYCTTLWGVLSQSGQYPDTLRKIRNGLAPSEDALEVAKCLLLGEYERLLPEDCLWQTGFYPTWNVEVVRYPGKWVLDDGTVINVYHHYSKLAD